MLLLAIESSGLVASVALMTEDKLIGEYTTNFKKTHSQTLLPMLDEVVRMTGISLVLWMRLLFPAGRVPLPDFVLARPQRRGWDWRSTSRL